VIVIKLEISSLGGEKSSQIWVV